MNSDATLPLIIAGYAVLASVLLHFLMRRTSLMKRYELMDDRKLLNVVVYSKIIRNGVKITAYSAGALLMLAAIVLKFNGAAKKQG